MPQYEAGDDHQVADSGLLAVSAPDALAVSFTAPTWVGADPGVPPRYRRVGWIASGDQDIGWQTPVAIVVTPQLIEVLPGANAEVAYSFYPGVQAQVRELHLPASGGEGGSQMPWDRNNDLLMPSSNYLPPSSGESGLLWEYVVPAGRRLMIHRLGVSIDVAQVGATWGLCHINVSYGGLPLLTLDEPTQFTGHREAVLDLVDFVLPVGTVPLLSNFTMAEAEDQQVGFTVWMWATLFDQ
jgi:hypothetical protein